MKIKMLTNLPTPINISLWWNTGSMLGMCMMIQMLTGIFLSMHYCPNINMAFESTINICRNINYGWMMRTTHFNTSSLLFLLIYLHISRGLYYKSYKMKKTWISGLLMLLLLMMTSFLGYVLPWGQMSFWGATVITNLLSSIPYIGNSIMLWVWGEFSISNPTLNRMYSIHFIMPFIIMIMLAIHLMFIHELGSNNPLGTNSNINKISFHPYFTIKDMMSMSSTLTILLMLILILPYKLSDPENFIQVNQLKTPLHIKPEWYFLFAYSILRSIPNKLGGVIAMISSILIFSILPFTKNSKSNHFSPLNKMMLWSLMLTFIMLTWLSTNTINDPYIMINQMFTLFYFLIIILLITLNIK